MKKRKKKGSMVNLANNNIKKHYVEVRDDWHNPRTERKETRIVERQHLHHPITDQAYYKTGRYLEAGGSGGGRTGNYPYLEQRPDGSWYQEAPEQQTYTTDGKTYALPYGYVDYYDQPYEDRHRPTRAPDLTDPKSVAQWVVGLSLWAAVVHGLGGGKGMPQESIYLDEDYLREQLWEDSPIRGGRHDEDYYPDNDRDAFDKEMDCR